jgi:hypothetical protein
MFETNKTVRSVKSSKVKKMKCAVDTCSIKVNGLDRKFCSHYHNHLEAVRKFKERFTAEDDASGIYLAYFVLDSLTSDTANRLQPHANKLPTKAQRVKGNDLPTLYTNFKPYLGIILAMLGVKVDGSDNIKLRDQKKRAKALVNDIMTLPSINLLRLMDGHGRFLFLFLENMMNRDGGPDRLRNLTIQWVDIDIAVHTWHSRMFGCPSLQCIHADMFELPTTDEMYVYLNFCGVGNMWDRLKSYLATIPDVNCMFSCSTARVAKRSVPLKLNTIGRNKQKVVTGRKDFVTYKLPAVKCHSHKVKIKN